MTDLLGDIDGAEVQTDDVLVHGKDQAQHDNRLNQVLNRLAESKITLNKVKCEFSVSKVKVLGHIVSSEGIAADPEKIEAIRHLAIPRNVSEVRSFLGMVDHVSKFADHLASKTKPLRELLKKKNTWVWGQPQDQAFTEIKEALTTAPILALYEPYRETKVNADASSYGICGVVMQQQDNGDWKPISYVSRALSPVECRYSQVEKECLAFVWVCERSSDFIWGKSITGETDHKPLVPMLTTHSLDQLPPRVQRLRMRLMRFNIKRMVHVPGKQIYTSDTLSRLQHKQPDSKPKDSLIPDQEMSAFVCSIIDALSVSDIKLKQRIEAQ